MSLRTSLNSILGKYDYQLVHRSRALNEHPDSCLEIDFNYIAAHHHTRTKDFFFVQVGANDGIADDPIREMAVRLCWRGVLIEPQRAVFERLQQNYLGYENLVFKNVAISPQACTKTLYTIDDQKKELPEGSSGWASFDKEILLKRKRWTENIEDYILEEEVACIPFSTLIDQLHITKIDLLQIDTEGFDFEVIKIVEFEKMKPTIIHYEHQHLSPNDRDAYLKFLIGHGYRIAPERNDTTAYLI